MKPKERGNVDRASELGWPSARFSPSAFLSLRGSMTKQLQATLAAILVMSAISVPAQVTTPTQGSASKTATAHKKKAATQPRETATERQIRELREQMQNQQAEIDNLKQENAAKDAALATAQQSATT